MAQSESGKKLRTMAGDEGHGQKTDEDGIMRVSQTGPFIEHLNVRGG